MYDCKYLQVEDATNGKGDVFDHPNYKYVCTKNDEEVIPYIHCNKKKCNYYDTTMQYGNERISKCKYCDGDSYECCIFVDPLDNQYYLDIETSEWNAYYDSYIHHREYINYCPYCGRKLGE